MQILQLSEVELDEWLCHTTECFAWKGTPKSHFESHYMLDPDKLVENILVVKDNSQIVSSLRIFCRQLIIDGKSVRIGGIGEVFLTLHLSVLLSCVWGR